MTFYARNRACPCVRCRAKGLMGAAILVTLGVLFLLDNYGIEFDRTWPVLLLVIGGVLLLSHTASTEGHVQPWWMAGGAPPSQAGPGTPPPQQPPANEPQVKP